MNTRLDFCCREGLVEIINNVGLDDAADEVDVAPEDLLAAAVGRPIPQSVRDAVDQLLEDHDDDDEDGEDVEDVESD